jgi:UDP-N-acetylmuramyl pentapeptide phosphotransferase/UDP-N-acetylglucosamine-1-phosphate transferase
LTGLFLGTFAGSLLFSFVFTKLVRDQANEKGWVAPPSHGRHLHSAALPRLGGVAIVFSFFLATGLALLLGACTLPAGQLGSLSPLITI